MAGGKQRCFLPPLDLFLARRAEEAVDAGAVKRRTARRKSARSSVSSASVMAGSVRGGMRRGGWRKTAGMESSSSDNTYGEAIYDGGIPELYKVLHRISICSWQEKNLSFFL